MTILVVAIRIHFLGVFPCNNKLKFLNNMHIKYLIHTHARTHTLTHTFSHTQTRVPLGDFLVDSWSPAVPNLFGLLNNVLHMGIIIRDFTTLMYSENNTIVFKFTNHSQSAIGQFPFS